MKVKQLAAPVLEAAKAVIAAEQAAAAASASREPKEIILRIPAESQIIELLNQGLDSYLICKQTGCTRLDVVNVERKLRGYRRLMSPTSMPHVPPDQQVSDPAERLLMFPPVD